MLDFGYLDRSCMRVRWRSEYAGGRLPDPEGHSSLLISCGRPGDLGT